MAEENKEIKIGEIQDERIWIHSNKLGYGRWIWNSQLTLLIQRTEE